LRQLNIQDGCPGLWLTEMFSTSTPELLHVTLPELPERFLRKYCCFSERFKIQHDLPGLWWAETFF
jgi:hypothetical protein